MSVSLSVIDHLGSGLYSSIPAVLSEAVANAWDADASRVEIAVDLGAPGITITDNGVGMNDAEINGRYLTVGFRRRAVSGSFSSNGRHVMGRKGIGKLSLFSIAKTVSVFTAKDEGDSLTHQAFRMELDDIQAAAAEEPPQDYYPETLAPVITDPVGTRIELSALTVRPSAGTLTALRKRLARRFSIIGERHGFEVVINGEPIGVSDRDYFAKLQYIWSVGATDDDVTKLATKADRVGRIQGLLPGDGPPYEVRGWLGTFIDQQSIRAEEEGNAVAVHAWGKLLHENLLEDAQVGGLFTKYLIGEVQADFVDDDDLADIATSDRQHLKEDDDRVVRLTRWFREAALAQIEREWSEWRRQSAMKTARALDVVNDWYEQLSPDARRFAEQLFGRIGRLHGADEPTKRELYKNAILAFERLRLRENLGAIDRLGDDADLETISAVFEGVDEVEAVQYHLIVQQRLEVIRKFKGLVDEDEKEKLLQKHIFEHLWLLHPSWERAATDERIEQSVTKEFEDLSGKLTEEEKSGRIDIRYRTAAGKHVIIELKRAGVSVPIDTLTAQLRKYRNALEKVLSNQFPDKSREIEVIAILGKPPTGDADLERINASLSAVGARYMTYDQLITEAQNSYRDYLEADKQRSTLIELVYRLDEVPEQTESGDGDEA